MVYETGGIQKNLGRISGGIQIKIWDGFLEEFTFLTWDFLENLGYLLEEFTFCVWNWRSLLLDSKLEEFSFQCLGQIRVSVMVVGFQPGWPGWKGEVRLGLGT